LSIQKNNGLPIKGRIGKTESECFNELSKYCDYKFRRCQIIGYLPDCYIPELNLIIEFNEEFHNRPWCKKKDKQKFKDLFQHLNCSFLVITKMDWLNNKENVINNFKEVISERANLKTI